MPHGLIVFAQPGFDLFAHPAWEALSPHQYQHLFALRVDLLT